MKSIRFALLALSFASAAFAAPPPAPTLGVAVTDIRQLEFSWDPVRGAQSYELWFLPAPGAQWVKYREQRAQRAPLFRVAVAVHLLDWRQARYYVKACNWGGCTPSNEVGVDGLQLDAIGFVKPHSPRSNRLFGSAVAVSADGRTFAAMSGESIGTEVFSATLRVYRKTTAASGWRREARLVPPVVQSFTTQMDTTDPVAISGDGNLLVLGTPGERVGSDPAVGAVYVYRRIGNTWTLTQKLSLGQANDNFGFVVKLDDAGRTLAILHGQHADNVPSTLARGTLEVYHDAESDGSDQFVHHTTVAVPPNTYGGTDEVVCHHLALSGDGRTMLRNCRRDEWGFQFTQVLHAPGWTESVRFETSVLAHGFELSYDGTTAAWERFGIAQVWKVGASGWLFEGELRGAFHWHNEPDHRRISLSRDGKILALGVGSEYTLGRGPIYPPYVEGNQTRPTGSVAIFERKPSGWRLRRFVKPDSVNNGMFGHSVALGGNGRVLIVGAPKDPSAAAGIDGDREDASSRDRGAVWVY
jgi:hypothetical protein